MNSRNLVAGIVGTLMLAMLIVPNVAGAAAGKQDVRVVNTATEPVPVTGSVSISGTPTVNIGGTPTVSLAGTPGVQVNQDPGNPVPVVVTGGGNATPFQFHIQFQFGNVPGGQRSEVDSFSVPEGKRLVIEHVTFSDLARSVGVETISIRTITGGENVNHYLAVTTHGDADSISQPITLYADPGTLVQVFITLTDNLGGEFSSDFMHGSIVGTLTDA